MITHFILIAGLLHTYMHAILQLLQWLVVKSMQLQPDIALGEVE
jgi:hypothetical protein